MTDNEIAILVFEEQGAEKRKPLSLVDSGRMKKRRKLEKLVDWGETPVGVEVEKARKWLGKGFDYAGEKFQQRGHHKIHGGV